jgi:hypothetical protein
MHCAAIIADQHRATLEDRAQHWKAGLTGEVRYSKTGDFRKRRTEARMVLSSNDDEYRVEVSRQCGTQFRELVYWPTLVWLRGTRCNGHNKASSKAANIPNARSLLESRVVQRDRETNWQRLSLGNLLQL